MQMDISLSYYPCKRVEGLLLLSELLWWLQLWFLVGVVLSASLLMLQDCQNTW